MKIVKGIINILLILFIMLDLLALTFTRVIKQEIKPTTIRKVVTKIDYGDEIDKIIDENLNFSDITKEALNFMGLNEKTLNRVSTSEATKDFLGIYVANATSYLLGSDEEIKITKDDLKNLINKNIPIIEEDMPSWAKDFIDKNQTSIDKYIDQNGEEIISLLPQPKDVLKDVKKEDIVIYEDVTLEDVTTTITKITSPKTFSALVVCGFIALAILIIINFKAKKWAKYVFIISLTYTIIILLAKFIIMPIISSIGQNIAEVKDVIPYLLSSINSVLWICLIVSIIVSITSILFYKINFNKKEAAL